MEKTIRRLPDAELEVMQAVWACEAPVARADIDAKLKDTPPWAMPPRPAGPPRPANKGFPRCEKQGRGARYPPLVRREEYLAQQGRRFLDKLCGGSLPAFAAALCDSGLSRQELAELRRLLERDEL